MPAGEQKELPAGHVMYPSSGPNMQLPWSHTHAAAAAAGILQAQNLRVTTQAQNAACCKVQVCLSTSCCTKEHILQAQAGRTCMLKDTCTHSVCVFSDWISTDLTLQSFMARICGCSQLAALHVPLRLLRQRTTGHMYTSALLPSCTMRTGTKRTVCWSGIVIFYMLCNCNTTSNNVVMYTRLTRSRYACFWYSPGAPSQHNHHNESQAAHHNNYVSSSQSERCVSEQCQLGVLCWRLTGPFRQVT